MNTINGPIKYFGTDYYPEHWPEERWETDAQLMHEAGFNTVRIAEFAWVKLEESKGNFNFDWLHRVIDILKNYEINTVLGTPTASAPAWLIEEHPEILRVNEHKIRASFGNRQFMCINAPAFRKASKRITKAMAMSFGNDESVIGWQIDNEFMQPCYCNICRRKFQKWLKLKYHTLCSLNNSWGTIFWSQTYSSWKQIPAPWTTATSIPGMTGAVNPGLYLDYKRFMTDSYISFQQEQIKILRKYSTGRFITHNYMGFDSDSLDYHKLAKDMDFVTWDNYPQGDATADPINRALNHDYTRGMLNKPFWVMEEQSGPAGWGYIGAQPRPGMIKEWSMKAVEHGAEGIIYFRWRPCRYGTEQYWHGILNHDGSTNRRYDEIKEFGKMITAGEIKIPEQPKFRAGMIYDFDSRHAFQNQPCSPQFSYSAHFQTYYNALIKLGYAVDIIPADQNISEYNIVIAPSLYVLKSDIAEKLREYVANGGNLISTFRSGVKDEYSRIVDMPLPGLMKDIFGIEIEEYGTTLQGEENNIFYNNEISPVKVWLDLIKPIEADCIAEYKSNYIDGKPAISLNKFKNGKALYVGTWINIDTVANMIELITK